MSEFVKNQHYVSQFILKRFANKSNQVYEFLISNNRFYITNTNKAMSEKYIYEHEHLKKNSLESIFSEIEGKFANEFYKIESYINKQDFQNVARIISSNLYEILIFYYRSGALLHEFSSRYDSISQEEKIELLISKIINIDYLIALSQSIIKGYKWSVIKSNNSNFLLSDQFISTAALSIKGRFLNVSNRQMGMKDVIILIPMSKDYYFVFFNGKKPYYLNDYAYSELTDKETLEINRVILNNSYKKCIAPVDTQFENILPYFEKESPSSSFAKYTDGVHKEFIIKKELFFYEEDSSTFEFIIGGKVFSYRKLKRNDMCKCGSKLKFKKCCHDYVKKAEYTINRMQMLIDQREHLAIRNGICELSIFEITSDEEPKLLKDIKSINNNI